MSIEPDTSMIAVNLAIVWALNLLKSPSETMEIVFTDSSKTNTIVTFLITHYPDLFDDQCTTQAENEAK